MPQTQTPATLWQNKGPVDYTPGSQVYAGDVVVVNGLPMVAPHDIPTGTLGALDPRNVYKVPKNNADTFAIGTPVYWNPTGNPTTGTAGTGCAQSSSAGAYFMGPAYSAALSTDGVVAVDLMAWERLPASPPNATVAAAGSTQVDAVALPASGFSLVTGANATKGAVILAGTARIEVKNDDAANAVLKVYPPGTMAINALTTSAAILMAAKTSAIFVAQGNIYYTIPLVPS